MSCLSIFLTTAFMGSVRGFGPSPARFAIGCSKLFATPSDSSVGEESSAFLISFLQTDANYTTNLRCWLQNDLELWRWYDYAHHFGCQFLPPIIYISISFSSYITNSGDFERLRISELKRLLKLQMLPVRGNKEVLVKRLIAASAEQSLGDKEVEQTEQE